MSKLIKAIELHAKYKSFNPAVVTHNQVMTYQALYESVATMSEFLKASKARRVALLADNSSDWIAVDLACINLNITLIPVPSFFSLEQIHNTLTSANVDLLMIQDLYAAKIDPALLCGRQIEIPLSSLKALPLESNVPHEAKDSNGISKITFTSGSTGYPKGVCLRHDMLEDVMLSLITQINTDTLHSHLSMLPFSILLENIFGIYAALYQANSLIIPDESKYGISNLRGLKAIDWISLFETYQPNTMILMPGHLDALIKGLNQKRQLFESLEFVAIGGAHVNPRKLEVATELGLPIVEGYGLSECGSVISLNRIDDNQIGTVGKVLPHVKYSIADDGELIVQSPHMVSYLGDQSLTKQVHTGDLVRMNQQGNLQILGRKKHLIINAYGRNISPEWIEHALLKSSFIEQVSVSGEAQTSLSAVVYASAHIEDELIINAIKETNRTLPGYAQIGHWARADQPFSLENGWMGVDLMPQRKRLSLHFKKDIQSIPHEDNYHESL